MTSSFLSWTSYDGDHSYDANIWCFRICIGASIMCWFISYITQNHSQVDKLWSIMPIVYSWICVIDIRTLIMACLVTIWGCRLTFNFYRRGGYTGEEDYRWLVLKGQTLYVLPFPFTILSSNKIVFELFNIMFISIYQHYLLFAITSPSLVAWNHVVRTTTSSSSSWTMLDWIATCFVLCFIIIETVADEQQYQFQQLKQRRLTKEQKSETSFPIQQQEQHFKDGFCQSGLFSLVRKPNYAAEQAIWCSYYLFSISATATTFEAETTTGAERQQQQQQQQNHFLLLNWSILGCLQLLLLFQGSGWLTEYISQQKYPSYKHYKQNVPLYVPSPIQIIKKCFAKNKKQE